MMIFLRFAHAVATLVEGPSDASLTYANSAARFTIGLDCSFSEAFAICTIVREGSTAVQTEMITHVPVKGGVTLTSESTLATATETAESPSSHASESPNSDGGGMTRGTATAGSSQTADFPSSSSNAAEGKSRVALLHIALALIILMVLS